MTAALEFKNVSKTYPGTPPVTAVADLHLRVEAGETVAVMGASGSGKSTLLAIAGTLERPSAGSVHLSGLDTSVLSEAELGAVRAWHIGFVFQQFFLLDHLTVLDNVATGLLYRAVPATTRREAARAAVARVGLGGRAHHRARDLSGGERQRVAIARALVGRPSLILADEPTGNLDSTTSAQIMTLVASLADAHTTVVVITHDETVARKMRRRVQLRDGHIVRDTDPP